MKIKHKFIKILKLKRDIKIFNFNSGEIYITYYSYSEDQNCIDDEVRCVCSYLTLNYNIQTNCQMFPPNTNFIGSGDQILLPQLSNFKRIRMQVVHTKKDRQLVLTIPLFIQPITLQLSDFVLTKVQNNEQLYKISIIA